MINNFSFFAILIVAVYVNMSLEFAKACDSIFGICKSMRLNFWNLQKHAILAAGFWLIALLIVAASILIFTNKISASVAAVCTNKISASVAAVCTNKISALVAAKQRTLRRKASNFATGLIFEMPMENQKISSIF